MKFDADVINPQTALAILKILVQENSTLNERVREIAANIMSEIDIEEIADSVPIPVEPISNSGSIRSGIPI